MKRATRGALMHIAAAEVAIPLEPAVAADALDSDARQAAELRRLRAAAREAVTEFKRRGESPWAACVALESALLPVKP